MKDEFRVFFTGFFKDFYGSDVSDEECHWAWQVIMHAGQYATLQSVDAFATTDFRGDLSSFNMPTLVIHGTEDVSMPSDATGRAVVEEVESATRIG